MTPDVSVVIPARNAEATIGRTLEALAGQTLDRDRYEVLVVDDGSADGTVAAAERAGARVLRQQSLGPGQARNRGAEESRAAILAFTDADCFPHPDWLAEGLAAIREADLVQGRVVADEAAPRGPFDHTLWVVRESGLYESANLFVRREAFHRAGGFEDWLDVRIGKRLGEDVWFGWKLRRAGGRTAFCEAALVEHAVFPRRWYEYVGERRRLVYFPALVRKVPELRRAFLTAGLFVTPRSGAFAGGIAGSLLGLALRRAGSRAAAPAALLAWAPYALLAEPRARLGGRFRPKVVVADVLADAVGFAHLLWGSARSRTPVL